MSFVDILLSVPDSSTTMNSTYLQLKASPINQISGGGLVNLMADMIEGSQLAYTKVSNGMLQASGTVTLSSMVATDTITVNGVVFTCEASGATGNQFNVGGTDTITAANAVKAINASVTVKVSGYVAASSVGAVITVTAVQPGLTGNLGTLAASAHATVVAPAGGSIGTQAAVNYGRPS